ncbi:MAG: hypothetical protein ACXVB0_03950 [Mucilaginibacter sp.]
MFRYFLFFAGFLFLAQLSFAQGNLSGRVYENKTRFPIAGITIQNLKSNTFTVSDKNGLFAIRAHVGDLITFSGFSYQTDTLYVKDLSSIEILLNLKQNMLKGVSVTSSETRLGNLTAAPTLSPFGGQTLVYQKDANGNYDGGLKLNVFDSNSAANKRKKDARLEKEEEIRQQIAKIFNPEALKDYVPITGQEMSNFIILYTPDLATFSSDDFNLTVYINSSYKEFLKVPPEKRQSKELTNLKN